MNRAWASFRRDPYFLTKYLGAHAVALVFLIAVIAALRTVDSDPALTWTHLLLLPIAFVVGIQVPVLMHNCMHANLSTRTSNLVLGELSSTFALMSLGILRVNHMLHHAFSDTDRDPHDPRNKSFWWFFLSAQFTGVGIVRKKYLEFHGNTRARRGLFATSIALHHLGQALRLALWFVLLGPESFVALFLPAYAVYSLAFAHINYITHQTDDTGQVEIRNMNGNAYYRLVNFIGNGVYFHRNHHLSPRLVNPMHLEPAVAS